MTTGMTTVLQEIVLSGLHSFTMLTLSPPKGETRGHVAKYCDRKIAGDHIQ